MKNKKLLIALLLLLSVLVVAGAVYYFRLDHREKHLTLYGNVDVRQVNIGFRVAGIVEQMPFEEGQHVTTNTLLAVLNKSPYDKQLEQAVANVEAIQVSFNNAEKIYKRRTELIGNGGVSQEDFENATSSYEQQKANLAQAIAAQAVAKDNLSYTEAFAPTSGVILTRIREPGTVVGPSDPVYTLSVDSPVWIRAYVDEPNLGNVYYGMEAEVYTDTQNTEPFIGKVGFISPIAEFTPKTVETTQLRADLVYRLRVYVDNPNNILKQGMPVTVRLKLPREKDDS